jgi:hypothetical protein
VGDLLVVNSFKSVGASGSDKMTAPFPELENAEEPYLFYA